MSEPSLPKQISALLTALEAAIKKSGLWSDTPPSEKAMKSTVPFACDTMTFEQWLQFLFIPKMHALINASQPLPSNIALVPMAEQTLPHSADSALVISVLEKIDSLLTGQVR